MLIPYAPEHIILRRIPYVTAAILVICLAVQIWSSIEGHVLAEDRMAAQQEVVEMLLEHPHLALGEGELEELLEHMPEQYRARVEGYRELTVAYRQADAAERQRVLESEPEGGMALLVEKAFSGKGGRGAVRARVFDQLQAPDATHHEVYGHLAWIGDAGERKEQEGIDLLRKKWLELKAQDPFLKFGFVPRNGVSLGLLTHMFVHGGWLHFIFNMLFLWLFGLSLEDRWGRIFFPLFYLGGGVVAALGNAAMTPEKYLGLPMVGASGAIAATMGAYLLHFAKTKIHILYFYVILLRPKWGRFLAPAWVVLPVWLLGQVWDLWLHGPNSGVAFWAHILGFGFGISLAVALKVSKLEERFLSGRFDREDADIESAGSLVEARAHIDAGRYSKAVEILKPMVSKEPPDQSARELFTTALAKSGRVDLALPWFLALFKTHVRQKKVKDVEALFASLGPLVPRVELPLDQWLSIARQLKAFGLSELSALEFESILRSNGVKSETVNAAITYGELVLKLGHESELARVALEQARAVAGDDPAWSGSIESLLKRLRR